MNFQFFGKADELSLYETDWQAIFNLGCAYGWKPKGTTLPIMRYNETEKGYEQHYLLKYKENQNDQSLENSIWRDGYFPSDGQVVSDDDAFNLGVALETALPNIPERRQDLVQDYSEKTDPAIWFSGSKGRRLVRQAIEFFKNSGFRITRPRQDSF